MYAPSDLRGLNAMVAAPATPDANRLDATDTVDVESLRDLINKLIDCTLSSTIAGDKGF